MLLEIEICFATPDRAVRQRLVVPAQTCLGDLRAHPELLPELAAAWDQASGIGVFGEPRGLDAPLAPGDRVELWRPLLADPKEARRERARLKREAQKKPPRR